MPDETVALAHRELGPPDRPPLLLLHGLTGQGADWATVAEDFAEDWRVYIVDLRGHGASPKARRYSFDLMRDDVIALLRTLDLTGVTVIGHSLGGVIGYRLAHAEPDLVRALVLEETPPPIPLDRPLPDAPDPDNPRPYDWRAVAHIIRQINAPGPELSGSLRAIKVPTLVIGGGVASHLPQDALAEVAAQLPNGEFATIEAGHCVHAERPDEFVRVVRRFFTRRLPADERPVARPEGAADGR